MAAGVEGGLKLHITGDDFGYCPQRNAGIIECFTSGGLTDTSLMVNATYTEEASRLGLEHGLPMGLHFNISEGKPLSSVTEVASLVNNSGCFLGKDETKAAAENGQLVIDQIKRELRAQIDKFKALTGRYPQRIDGHQHVHIFPTIREAFAQVLGDYKVSLTRIPNDPSLEKCDWMVSGLKVFLEDVARHAQSAQEVFSTYGIRTSDAFIGSSLMNFNSTANLTLNHLQTVLACVPPEAKSVELMVHPGYPNEVKDGGCGIGPDDFSKDVCRQWELEFLISKELKEYVREKGLQVKSWES